MGFLNLHVFSFFKLQQVAREIALRQVRLLLQVQEVGFVLVRRFWASNSGAIDPTGGPEEAAEALSA
jgi:hypothetical protein